MKGTRLNLDFAQSQGAESIVFVSVVVKRLDVTDHVVSPLRPKRAVRALKACLSSSSTLLSQVSVEGDPVFVALMAVGTLVSGQELTCETTSHQIFISPGFDTESVN
ncbi:hypothetical protein J6590_014943 [Homalodisca vitripennis]|nr:hypothetical protein J6590_014943 [Homalodisca vitripennis]